MNIFIFRPWIPQFFNNTGIRIFDMVLMNVLNFKINEILNLLV